MSNTPEDTELQKEIESFLYITNHSKYYYLRLTQVGHDPAVAGIDLDAHVVIKRILNLITLNTQKAIEKDRTIRDPKVRLWTLNFVYSPTNPMFTQKNVEEYIADLPNPTEAGEK